MIDYIAPLQLVGGAFFLFLPGLRAGIEGKPPLMEVSLYISV